MKKECLVCKIEFVAKKSKQKFCSHTCARKTGLGQFKPGTAGYWTGKKRSEEDIEKMSEAALGRIPWNKGKTLSEEYRKKLSDAHKGLPSHWIGKKHTESSKLKNRLAKLGKRGPLSWNWKGGLTDESKLIRGRDEIKEWRRRVYKRDGFRCRKCKHKGKLVAHHIRNFAEFPLLRTVLVNGITLCGNCHVFFHKKYGFKHNTVWHIKDFLNLNPSFVGGNIRTPVVVADKT